MPTQKSRLIKTEEQEYRARLSKIRKQEPQLFCKRLADNDRQIRIILVCSFRKSQLHGLRLFA